MFQWVKYCKWGNMRNEVTTRLMRILGVLKQIGQWCLLVRHVRGRMRGGGYELADWIKWFEQN